MKVQRIHRGRHYRRCFPALAVRRILLHLLDWTAMRFGRHGRLVMRLRANLNRGRI